MEWAGRLLDLGLGGLPAAVAALCPDPLKRQALARLADHDPFRIIAVNHDLVRATRLAWIEAARAILDAAEKAATIPDWRSEAAVVAEVVHLARTATGRLRDRALDSSRHPGETAIDNHVTAILRGVPEFVAPGGDSAAQDAVTAGFAAVLAELIGWPPAEMPSLFGQLAHQGLPVRGDGPRRAFGDLVFAAFAELIKNPRRYPEAQAAFAVAMDKMALDLGEATLAAVRGLDNRLDAALAGLDALDTLRNGATRHLGLLPAIAEDMSALREGFGRVEARIDDQTVMLRELLARTAPGLPLATARAILKAFGAAAEGEDPAQIEHLLRAKAEEYQALQARLATMGTEGDATIAGLMAQAGTLIAAGSFEEAEACLLAAEDHADVAHARIRAGRADLALLRLDEWTAARLWGEAADMLPAGEVDLSSQVWTRAGLALLARDDRVRDVEALKESIALFKARVLPLNPPTHRPIQWAAAQDNLGTAHLKLGLALNDATELAAAIAAHRAALSLADAMLPSDLRAAISANLGAVLMHRGRLSGQTADLKLAAHAFGESLEHWRAKGAHAACAMVLLNLASVFADLGEREPGAGHLEAAVATLRSARTLQVDWAPEDRAGAAMIAMNLGNALWKLAGRSGNLDHAQEAAGILRAALKELDPTREPHRWAGVQANLGNVLAMLAAAQGDAAGMAEALEALDQALAVRTGVHGPLERMGTVHQLAVVCAALFELTDDPAMLDRAEVHAREASELYEATGATHGVAAVAALLAAIEAARGDGV